MEPLLKTIARVYSQRYKNLKEFCFIFPNKRCGLFLRKYLGEQEIHSEDLPHIFTISEFMGQVARLTEAGKIEQLFTLFKAYKELADIESREVAPEFDDFRGWGETVLSDFNIVDTNLVDTSEIFKNIKDYREITSNFLTDDQKEVMKEYFGVEATPDMGEFWKFFEDVSNLSHIKKSFVNLWQILDPLHEKFEKMLMSKGLGSTGIIYRNAARRIKERGKEVLPYKKIVAVGFNALSESERSVFRILKDEKGYAGYDEFMDFIWDATGPIFRSEKFTASRFVDFNKTHFPVPEWVRPELEKEEVTEWPEITIVSAPSNTIQTQIAGEIIDRYISSDSIEEIRNAEIALVLPDEGLLSNMLYSLPDRLDEINLTMGLTLKQTGVASFIYLLRRVYATTRQGKEKTQYYTKDLRMLFSHPLSYELFGSEEIEKFKIYISRYHRISITEDELKDLIPEAQIYLNFPPKNEKSEEIFDFLINIFNRLIERLSASETQEEKTEEKYAVALYREYVNDLHETMKAYQISMEPLAVVQLADKLLSAEKIGFEGEPLSGLQVMGTLETRSLDFKDIIILSMNEGVMPRKSMTSTFIPETLRKAYGLPPARYAEEIFGYYFYRLLSRARNVTLIYDGRAASGTKGAESRYLLQLVQYAPKDKIKIETRDFRLQTRKINNSSIKKSPEIKKLTEDFSSTNEGRRNLSASSLNTYRECQVRFYLQNLMNLSSDPPKGDYMDAITIGNVLHEVMMELYIMDKDKQRHLLSEPIEITEEYLSQILSKPEYIRTLIDQKISKFYFGEEDSGAAIKSGITEMMADQIVELVTTILDYDKRYAPFNLYGCEIAKNIRVKLRSGRVVNFRFAIDRLDSIEEGAEKKLRIIDYKTGSKKRFSKDLEEVFKGGYKSEQIFQLFTYAWLLGKIGFKGWEDVLTEIYFVPDLIKGERGFPELGKDKVTSFRPYMKEFGDRLESMIEDIFVSDIFAESKDTGACEKCAFQTFCNK